MKFVLNMAKMSWGINQNALNQYLIHNQSSTSTHTFWDDLHEFPPATVGVFKDGQLKTNTYWNFKHGTQKRSEADANEEFMSLFEDSLTLRMQADVEVGTLLSGGLDSTTLVCSLQKLGFINNNNFKSFSGIYDEAQFTETNYIKDTVAQTGLNAAFVPTNPMGIVDDLSKLNHAIEEPFRSMSVYTQYLLYKHIRATSDVKVVINGQGADELFGGYNHQYRILMAQYLSKGQLGKFSNELQFLNKYRPNTFKRIFRFTFLKMVQKAFVTPHYFNADGYSQVMTSPLREYLKYDDRTSMQYGVEARAPFMDYRLVEFALSLETKYKIDKSINKKIIRHYAHDLIPPTGRDRKDKMGFTSPQALWQRRELKPNFDQTMDEILKHDFIKIPDLKLAYEAYQKKNKGDFFYFWRIYNLYHWCKDWNVI